MNFAMERNKLGQSIGSQSREEQQPLPSCRDLIKEVDELHSRGFYNAPRLQPRLKLPQRHAQLLRKPLHTILNTDEHVGTKIIQDFTPNANDAVPDFLSDPAASSASGSGTCFNDSEVSTFEFSADASFNSSDSKVNIYGVDRTCLVLDNSSLEWYNSNQSSISSPLSASPSEEIGNSEVQGARGTECGDVCLQVSQTALLQQYSSCSFSSFGSRPATTNAPPFSRQKSSSSALYSVPKLIGSVHTTAPHNPASGKRHFFLEVRNPILEFHMPSACAKTKGVAVIDILAFEGQCIVDPGASVASELTNGDLQKASIDLIIEWKGHAREVIMIPVRCGCGHEIKKGQIALEIARAHNRYFATQRCDETYRESTDIVTGIEDLRLMALHTLDNGVTWRAQHAVVESFVYETMEYQTQKGECRSSMVAYSGRGPNKKFIAWVRDRVEA